MELSLYLAQLFGLTMIILVTIVAFRPVLIERVMSELRTSSFAMLVAGFVGVMGGLAVVLSHNVWEFNWRGLVTLFGWAALIKGITYVAFPDHIIKLGERFMRGSQRNIPLLIMFLLACYLTYSGFNLS